MAYYNRLTKAERALWHGVAGSAVPADAVTAFIAAPARCPACGGSGCDQDGPCEGCGEGRIQE